MEWKCLLRLWCREEVALAGDIGEPVAALGVKRRGRKVLRKARILLLSRRKALIVSTAIDVYFPPKSHSRGI